MSTSRDRLQYLLLQYANNNCTRTELLELLQHLDTAGHDEVLHNTLQNLWLNMADTDELPAIDKEMIFSNIIAEVPLHHSRAKRFTWLKLAAAAVLVLAVGTVAYFYLSKKDLPSQESVVVSFSPFKNDKAALTGKAILSLADGTEIILNDAPNGTLARQGNTSIIKRNNRQLVYTIDPKGKRPEDLQFNILTTPPGMQYEIVLADGSHVWVNAASAIRIPTAFAENERSVAMSGEAYFEVASLPAAEISGGRKKIPFNVNVLSPTGGKEGGRGAVVEVLGTHFNIQAYENEENIKTTLLEGRVKVSGVSGSPGATYRSQLLTPGQQAQLKANGDIQVTNDINVNEAVAWTKGELIFKNLSIAEAAPLIERWYNVHVVIKDPKIATCRVTASFLKGETIQQVMDVISAYYDLNWQMKNGTITLAGKGCD